MSEIADPMAVDDRAGDAEGTGIRDFLSMLMRHKWASIIVFIVAVGVGALNSFRAERVYSSTPVMLEITAAGSGVATVRDVFERELLSTQSFETMVNVLRSDSILRHAYDSCPEVRSTMDYSTFAGGVSATPMRNCYLVQITFESPWPEVNPFAANAVARSFIQVTRQQRETRTNRVGLELEARRDELRDRLEAAEKDLAEFHTRHQKADVLAEKAKVDQQLALLEAQHDQKLLALLSLEKAYREVESARRAGNLAMVAEVLSDKSFQEMEGDIRRKEAELFGARKTYTPDAEQLKVLESELRYLEARRDRYVEAIVGKIEAAFVGGKAEVEKIAELRDARSAVQHELARLVVEQTNLEVVRDRIRLDLDEVAKQATDVSGVTGFDLSPGIIHEEAEAYYVPVRPRHTRDMMMAVFLAALLGVGVSYLLEQFNDAATRPEDVSRATGLPILGMLPRRAASSDRPDLAAMEDPHGEVSEAVRIIRTCILYTPSGKAERRKILVTSAEPGEGKTLFATNLAVSLAQAGQSTLLVDGDLRRPRLHKVFGQDNHKGLTHIFTNGSVKPPSHRVGESSGSPFDVVFSGPIPPNPAELVGGRRMTEFLEASTQSYDRIVIDCPPAGPVSDPALLARQVDGVILVVHLGKTSIRSLRRACDHLQKVAAPLLGVVLNGKSMGGGYQFYSSQYGSNAGEDEKKTGSAWRSREG